MPNILSPVKNSFYNLNTNPVDSIVSYLRIRKFPVTNTEIFLLLCFLFIFWIVGHRFGLDQTGIVSL